MVYITRPLLLSPTPCGIIPAACQPLWIIKHALEVLIYQPN